MQSIEAIEKYSQTNDKPFSDGLDLILNKVSSIENKSTVELLSK